MRETATRTKKRAEEYNKLSELASHANYGGFRLTSRGRFAELGPFVDGHFLIALLEEMVLRLGPTAVMYANQFPNAEPQLVHFFQEVGTELVQGCASLPQRAPRERQLRLPLCGP